MRTFRGNYSEYKARIDEEAAASKGVPQKAKAPSSGKGGNGAKGSGKKAGEKKSGQKETSQAAGGGRPNEAKAKKPKGQKKPKNPWRLEKLEEAIITLETKREELLAALGTEAVYKDPNLLRDTQLDLAEVERDLEEKNTEWERYAG